MVDLETLAKLEPGRSPSLDIARLQAAKNGSGSLSHHGFTKPSQDKMIDPMTLAKLEPDSSSSPHTTELPTARAHLGIASPSHDSTEKLQTKMTDADAHSKLEPYRPSVDFARLKTAQEPYLDTFSPHGSMNRFQNEADLSNLTKFDSYSPSLSSDHPTEQQQTRMKAHLDTRAKLELDGPLSPDIAKFQTNKRVCLDASPSRYFRGQQEVQTKEVDPDMLAKLDPSSSLPFGYIVAEKPPANLSSLGLTEQPQINKVDLVPFSPDLTKAQAAKMAGINRPVPAEIPKRLETSTHSRLPRPQAINNPLMNLGPATTALPHLARDALARVTERGPDSSGSFFPRPGSGGGESVSVLDQTGEDFLGGSKESEPRKLSGAVGVMVTAMAGGGETRVGGGGSRGDEGQGQGVGVLPTPTPVLPQYVKADPTMSVYVLSTPRKFTFFPLLFPWLSGYLFPQVS